MKHLPKYLVFCFVVYAFVTSCKKEEFTFDSSHKIEVSKDTLWFDTVFTKVNSAPQSVNKQIIIRNPYNQSIKTNIELAGGMNSHFRLNVDGEPGYSFKDIEIFPNDSVFLFVEVHRDPNNNSPDFNPLIIRDSILYYTNGNEQKTNLIGWGQDAHYIFRDSIEIDTTWANDKLPIVVYGYCYVKPNVTLTIEKGMQLHFAPSSWLFVEGKVDIKGSKAEPVLMQGDRLQPDWEETAGQWGGIWINYPSHSNTIEHAIIKNGTVGVYCDTVPGVPTQPNVTIRKSYIRNMSFDGVAGRHSTIKMENSVSENCRRFTFLASFGGDYDIRNCTFYTGGKDFSRQGPTFAYLNVNRDEFNNIISTHPIKFYFVNNIIHGVYADGEIGRDLDLTKVIAPSVVDYNLLKTNDAIYSGSGSNNLINKDPKFKDTFKCDFDLDTLSAAKDKGLILSPPITDDFCDRVRDATPDIGAFESQF